MWLGGAYKCCRAAIVSDWLRVIFSPLTTNPRDSKASWNKPLFESFVYGLDRPNANMCHHEESRLAAEY